MTGFTYDPLTQTIVCRNCNFKARGESQCSVCGEPWYDRKEETPEEVIKELLDEKLDGGET